jgi:hypothetical protein
MKYTIRQGSSVYMTVDPNNPTQNTVWSPEDSPVYNPTSCVFDTARAIIFDDADIYDRHNTLNIFRLPLSASNMLGLKMTRVYMVVSTFNVTDSI